MEHLALNNLYLDLPSRSCGRGGHLLLTTSRLDESPLLIQEAGVDSDRVAEYEIYLSGPISFY